MRLLNKILIFCCLVALVALFLIYIVRNKRDVVSDLIPKKDELFIVIPPDLSPGMTTMVIWPIIDALLKASEFTGVSDTKYQTTNPVQEFFFKQYYPKKNELSKFKKEELRSWASHDYEELNTILRREGFSIELEPFAETDFGTLSILDILVYWKEKGIKTKILDPGTNRSYPAVKIEEGFRAYQSSTHKHPIARIETKSGDIVWMTIADKKRVDFELLAYVDTIKNGLKSESENYTTVTFPMVDLDDLGEKKGELPWLIGLMLVPELTAPRIIAQALQQTKLKMNEEGTHVKSAVAIKVKILSPGPPRPEVNLLIDKPFYLWIEREGISSPIFVGYIDQTYWKDPGTLDIKPLEEPKKT